LNEGKYTPGWKSEPVWDEFNLNDYISGKSFIDVGASDGMYSFEAERYGAPEVLAIDIWEERADANKFNNTEYAREVLSKDTFDLVHKYVDSNVKSKYIDIMDLSPEAVGTYDVVFCNDVLNIVEEPYRAVKNLVSVADDRVVIAGTMGAQKYDSPAIELANEESKIKWFPNEAGYRKLLRDGGCDRVKCYEANRSASDRRVPDTWLAKIRNETNVYKSRELNNIRFCIPKYGQIEVLYDAGDLYRIEYNSGPTIARQGWISADVPLMQKVEVRANKHIPSRAKQLLIQEGPNTLFRKMFNYIQNSIVPTQDSQKMVFHGIID
jgi:tRNA (mo5U34)-methyltransferase